MMGGYQGTQMPLGMEGILQCALEQVVCGIAVIDGSFSLAFANGRLWEMLGLTAHPPAQGTPWLDVIALRLKRDLAQGIELGSMSERLDEARHRLTKSLSETLTYYMRLPDERVIKVMSQPVSLPPGGTWKHGPGLVRTFTDVSASQEHEAEAIANRDRYALALQATNEGIYDWDIPSNSIFFSKRLRDLFGLPSEYLSPEDWASRILPDDLPVYRSTHRAHLKGQTERFGCEYRIRCGDGRIAWVRQHGMAQRDAKNHAVRLTGSVGDVTEYRMAGEALKQSEERYAVAMQALNEGVYEWIVSPDQVLVTDRLRELFALQSHSLTSQQWVDRIHPSDKSRFLKRQRALLKGETKRLVMEYRLSALPLEDLTPDPDNPAHWRWILQRGISVQDDSGHTMRIIGSSGDITEQRRAEQDLQHSQLELARERELLMATLENMDQGIFMADSALTLLAFNRRFCEMFDIAEDSLSLGTTLLDVLDIVWNRGDVPLPLDKAREKFLGDTVCLNVNTHEIRRPNGRVLEARNVPLADGSFVRTFTDVTERKAAEDSIRDLIEAVPLPLVVTDLDNHTVLYANRHAQDAYRIVPGMGSVTSAYVDPNDRHELVRRLKAEGEVNGFDTRLYNPQGGVEWAFMGARRLIYDGIPALLVASSVITERKTLEQDLKQAKEKAERALDDLQNAQQSLIEAEKMASLGGLVAGVAHEINTPVGITLTTASHLQEKVTNLKKLFETGKIRKQEFADFITLADNACTLLYSNCTRAANLIQSFKQVAVDQSSEEQRAFILDDYIREVLLSLGPKLKRTPHRVHVNCPPDLQVNSYPGPLSQILTNFVMNSLIHGFSDDDEGIMEVSVTPPDADGMITLSYSDNGKGIPEDHVKKVFEPFFTTRRGEGGSGLGLNIVYNLVTQFLRGSIIARSSKSQGAEFVIQFPQTVDPAKKSKDP